MFTSKDLVFFKAKGIAPEVVQGQVDHFVSGFPFLNIDRAATLGDGICKLGLDEARNLADTYDNIVFKGLSVQKFVPASGAATRMFKDLFEFADHDKASDGVSQTLANIRQFAFTPDLQAAGVDFSEPKTLINSIIREPLRYGQLPKGLVQFHSYMDGNRTALEEHLVEGAMYGLSCGKPVAIHFTVSPEHLELFDARVTACIEKYKERFGVNFAITYSTQKSSTDTIAVGLDNTPVRNEQGELLFRPSGHGALLENLADLNADVIFIKTVDNVQPDHLKTDTLLYKKALGAIAHDIQQKIFSYLRTIDNGTANPEEIITFIESKLGYRLGASTNFDHLRSVLDRPLRVCGMVRNQGEPGGGPFWVKTDDGCQSLQIAESSQISPEQKQLMKEATHFNPVDLVCMTYDHTNQKFDLNRFRDPATGFISEKSHLGKPLKAQELPGLWNGAMAHWNTIFVEVPITTFSPVKTIVDLLRPEHQ